MPADEPIIHLLTRGAYYRGRLRFTDAPTAVRPRLLDYLNSQARGRRGGAQKTAPMLRLDDVDIVVYRVDSKAALRAAQVAVAPAAVVVAFDERTPPSAEGAAPQAAYERRQALEEEALVILTRTRHRVSGIVRGGVKTLSARSGDEPFVPITDVTIDDLSTEARAPAILPFVALNMDFVESFWKA